MKPRTLKIANPLIKLVPELTRLRTMQSCKIIFINNIWYVQLTVGRACIPYDWGWPYGRTPRKSCLAFLARALYNHDEATRCWRRNCVALPPLPRAYVFKQYIAESTRQNTKGFKVNERPWEDNYIQGTIHSQQQNQCIYCFFQIVRTTGVFFLFPMFFIFYILPFFY